MLNQYIGKIQDTFEASRHTDPLIAAVFVLVGLGAGWFLSALFSGGIGKVEQRAVSTSYRSGYQSGYKEGHADASKGRNVMQIPTAEKATISRSRK